MRSQDTILWCVDAQKDFMLPEGKLYVPGAEKLLPRINKLVDLARTDQAFLVSHGCFHTPNDPEFSSFPPHCIKGTPGAEFVPEALAPKQVRMANDPESSLPSSFEDMQQIVLEKQTLDIFQSRHADALLARLPKDAEFTVFGVVTEFCVRFAAKGLIERGRKASVVIDAIETLGQPAGEQAICDLKSLGAKLISTEQALAQFARGNPQPS
jgi:nicotinamidase/pyrazinamidase